MNCIHCNSPLEQANQYRFCPFCGKALIEPADSDVPTTETAAYQAAQKQPEKTAADDPRFSETRWFLAATKPEDLSDTAAENYDEIDQLTEPYENTEKLPTTLRKKFSLTQTGELPKSDNEK